MKKNSILLLLTIVMLVLPWLAKTLFRGNGDMAIIFALFFAVNPVFSLFIGVHTGKNIKSLWYLPLINALLYLIGTWTFFDRGERAFLLYAGVYLVIGYLTAAIYNGVSKRTCHI